MQTCHYYLPLPLPYHVKKELREKGIAGNRRKNLRNVGQNIAKMSCQVKDFLHKVLW